MGQDPAPIDDDPISEWVQQLAAGDSVAQTQLWAKFEERLRRFAKRRLTGVQCRDSDEDDVMNRVWGSLFQRLNDGRLKPPANRRKFWALLAQMTRNKSADEARRKKAQKRGEGRVLSMVGSAESGIQDRQSRDPFVALERSEQLFRTLQLLGSLELRKIAVFKMQNYTNIEIADALGVSERTVERRVSKIRHLLLKMKSEKVRAVLRKARRKPNQLPTSKKSDSTTGRDSRMIRDSHRQEKSSESCLRQTGASSPASPDNHS